MAITAAMVKELREMTGAGMMDCKKALNEVDGDRSECSTRRDRYQESEDQPPQCRFHR